jgi:hypothetical protein
MNGACLARLLLLIPMASAVTLGADATQWGPVESGLQLGVSVNFAPQPELHISLRNTGEAPRELAVGEETTAGTVYNIEWNAVGPGSVSLKVFSRTALRVPPSSQPASVVTAHLNPGEVREFVYPWGDLTGVLGGKDVPLGALAAQGYRIRAVFGFAFGQISTPVASLGR